MPYNTPVEIADRYSRRRSLIAGLAGLAFLAHVAMRPWIGIGHLWRMDLWAVNAIMLLLVLATGGGLLNRREIQLLVNDEVSRSHYRTALVAGYWVAMIAGMGLYVFSRFATMAGRDAVYIIVSASLVVALLKFSYLEYRAHRDD
jgi:hypothetical protein